MEKKAAICVCMMGELCQERGSSPSLQLLLLMMKKKKDETSSNDLCMFKATRMMSSVMRVISRARKN